MYRMYNIVHRYEWSSFDAEISGLIIIAISISKSAISAVGIGDRRAKNSDSGIAPTCTPPHAHMCTRHVHTIHNAQKHTQYTHAHMHTTPPTNAHTHTHTRTYLYIQYMNV